MPAHRVARRLWPLALAATALALAPAAALGAPSAAPPRLTVFAAASLTDVLPRIDPRARYSFGGSNTLAAQIEQGAPADVFASADTALPRRLAREGLCSTPVVFARNALVLIVPRSNPARIESVYDLRKPGTKLVVADPGVPVGAYTLQALRTMKLSGVLANVVSRETDVREVLAKVALGEADAGFVYATDAKTLPGKVTALKLPARARPEARYAICVASSSRHQGDARAFVARVLSRAGQAKLVAAGFLPRAKGQRK